MASDVNYILQAFTGRIEMLSAIFGSGKKDEIPPVTRDRFGDPVVLSPDIFDLTFPDQAPGRLRTKKMN